jgi:hypothetical protein
MRGKRHSVDRGKKESSERRCQRGHPVPEARRFASETSERISQSEGATSSDKTRGITAILKIEVTQIIRSIHTLPIAQKISLKEAKVIGKKKQPAAEKESSIGEEIFLTERHLRNNKRK